MPSLSKTSGMDDLLKKVQTLSPAKRRLLEKRLATAGANFPLWNNIPKRSQADQAPLSFAQERLWNSQQLDPDSSIYHMVTALHVTGPLNTEALKQSFREIGKRHESFRTTFPIVQGTARQVIHSEPRLDWRERDLSPLPRTERLEQARTHVRNAANKPFDLGRGPLSRTVLIRIDEREFVFAFVVHHLVFDGTSFGILYRELASRYAAHCQGDAAARAAPPLQYADYAEWQRTRLEGAALESQSSYWQEKLADLSPLSLPTDFPRPQRTTFTGGHVSLSLTQTSVSSLTQLANEAGCTPFAVLLAGFAVLLARYSQQADISLLVHCDNRDRPEIESVMGNFVNTLIIRIQVPGTLSFKDLLSSVHRTVMEAHTHKDYPFARLLDHLSRLAGSNSTRPFQAYFNMRNPENGSLNLQGLDVEPFSYTDQRSTKLDLTLETQIEAGQLSGSATYNADILAEDTVRGLLRHYDMLLGGLVQHPGRSLESHTLWPARQFSYPPNLSLSASPKPHLIHQFMDHVRTAPDTLAVETSRESWSYARLNDRVDQIAAHLQASCGENNARIALLLPPGISQIAATLATFKRDAIVAWLPTASCEKTLTAALHTFQAGTVVTDLSHAGRIRPLAPSSTRIITLNECLGSADRDLPCPPEALHARLCLPTHASDATDPSGPGASYTQCELSYHIGNYAQALDLKRADRLLCLCPCDPATVALSSFAALARGATWVHGTLESSVRPLQERLDRQGITILHTNPAN
ncbi:MAG: AMP-binding protein, partial [Planctomycetes bacterium]|nr:AMP-binding protein [Planctomycetota bacterium]